MEVIENANEILSDLTDTARPEDDPSVEHYQTGPILEILYDEKPDYPCLLTSEPVTSTLMTNIIALHKDNPGAPARVCKHCAITSIDVRHQYCQWAEAV